MPSGSQQPLPTGSWLIQFSKWLNNNSSYSAIDNGATPMESQ